MKENYTREILYPSANILQTFKTKTYSGYGPAIDEYIDN